MIEDVKIKIFLSLCEQGSFTAAARELGISQPAVSQNIAELERILGRQLFERSQGAIILTEEGEVFKHFALRISRDYAALNTVFSDFDSYKEFVRQYHALKSDPRFEVME